MPRVETCLISDDKLDLPLTAKFRSSTELERKIRASKNPDTLYLVNCSIETPGTKVLPKINKLKKLVLKNCDENIFQAFSGQISLEIIEVHKDDWTWNGFPHDIFNQMCKNCKNLKHLVLKGAGTGSYFDSDEFPFEITKFETSMITFHWYVGIKDKRVDFLKSQNGSLKQLTIHELPNDFDGGKVLNYIFEDMKLETFYYGKIPLILNEQKQKVKEFTATELQITSIYEMVNQFPSIEKFKLKLSNTEVSSEAIEKIINPPTDVFNNIKEFEVIDNSQGTLGVFLGLFKNLKNVQKLTFITSDKSINKIINELPHLPNLKEIQLSSAEPIPPEVDTTKFSQDFKFTKAADNNEAEPQGNVGGNDGGADQDDINLQAGGDDQRENEGADLNWNRREGGGNGGDDDGSNRDNMFRGCEYYQYFESVEIYYNYFL